MLFVPVLFIIFGQNFEAGGALVWVFYPSFFADYVVLFARIRIQDQHFLMVQHAKQWEETEVRISTSKSETMVLDRKKIILPFLGGSWRAAAP